MCELASGRSAQILGPVVVVPFGHDRVVTVFAHLLILSRIDVLDVLGKGGAQRGPGRLLNAVEAHGLGQPGTRLLANFRLDDTLAVAQRGTGAGEVALLGVLVPPAEDLSPNLLERVERVEHDSLLDPAQEVLSRRAPLVFNLNVEQTTEMVVEAVTPAALGDVERRL